MKKQIVYRAAAATVLGLSLTTGVVAADSISNSAPWAHNHTASTTHSSQRVTNTNAVNATSHNYQSAHTGSATTAGNPTGSGGATTGDARNTASVSGDITVSNTASSTMPAPTVTPPAPSSIQNSGMGAHNSTYTSASASSTVTNNNYVRVTSDNVQNASSGEAGVYHNVSGGDATSGDASNSYTGTFTVNVSD